MPTYLPPVSEQRLGELVAEWNERAEQLEGEAADLRREGFPAEAEEYELAAIDYRNAAEGIV